MNLNSEVTALFLRAESPAHNSPGQRRLRRRPGLRNKNIQPPWKGIMVQRFVLFSCRNFEIRYEISGLAPILFN